MSKRAKGSLIHGTINIMLPLVLVLIHSGAFAALLRGVGLAPVRSNGVPASR